MSIELEPAELGFQRPFNVEVSQILKIKNPNNHPVAFKVKTTAPKQYCVRPNSGRIAPGEDVSVTVLLQAMKQDPPLEAKCRDKFLVQSVALNSDNEYSYEGSIWQNIDETEKSFIKEKKIRVIHLPPQQSSTFTNRNILTPNKNGSPAVSSLDSDMTYSANNTIHRSPSPETMSTIAEPFNSRQDYSASRSINARTPPKIDVTSSEAINHEQVNNISLGGERTIGSYIEESGMRQRKEFKEKSAIEETTMHGDTIPQISQGVPLPTVALLCFISFLLAYIFF